MTECERLLENGFITKEFLQEETRDGYLVSAEMKKVWAIEMDLLRKFISVCEKYHLCYWVGEGTLLGTIRHKGFIPWDDDLDVWMPREDYDRLLLISPEEFEEPYFLQTTENDQDYYCAFARLRNCRTTAITVSEKNQCNNGIYIDILPLDGLYRNTFRQEIKSFRIHIYNILANAYVFNTNHSRLAQTINKILHLSAFRFSPQKIYRKVNRICRKIPWERTTKVGDIVFTSFLSPYKELYLEKKDFDATINMPFEGMTVRVPKGYDTILRHIYHEYMKFPPVESRGNWHHFTFDPDHAYNHRDEAHS